MNGKFWIALGAFSAALAVALGAFGAHGLEKWVEENVSDPAEQVKKLENWQTASRYQIWHALGMILLGFAMLRFDSAMLKMSGSGFLVGTMLFSGVMYAYVLTGVKTLGMILPLGGLAFMAAWCLFGIAVFRDHSDREKGQDGNG
ncbi:MAG: DUF423 domain-containing protein [Planctomycetota bacterium]